MAKKVMTLSPRSGGYDVHTPADARGYLLPSVQERAQQLRAQVEQLEKRRTVVHELLGHPSKQHVKKHKHQEHLQYRYNPELLKEYFDLGDSICECHQEISLLNTHLQKTTDENFETMFVRAAKNILMIEDFERVKKYTHLLMSELAETVCLPDSFIHETESEE